MHGTPEALGRNPVRRILEARDVEHQNHIARREVPADGREVTAARLIECGSIVRIDHHSIATCGRRKSLPPRGRIAALRAKQLDSRSVASCETRDLVEIESATANFFVRDATVQVLFCKPAPRPFPQTSWID